MPDTGARHETQNLMNQRARAQPQVQGIAAPAQVPGQIGQAGQHLQQAQNVYQFGPLRIAFGNRQGRQGMQQNNVLPAPNINAAGPATGIPPHNGNIIARPGVQTRTVAGFSPATASSQLQQIEQQLMREISGLQLQREQLYFVQALQGELARLRLVQTSAGSMNIGPILRSNESAGPSTTTLAGGPAFTSYRQTRSTDTNRQHLPTGMTLPEGWTCLPLRHVGGIPTVNAEDTNLSSSGPAFRTDQTSTSTQAARDTHEAIAVHEGGTATEPHHIDFPADRNVTIGSTQLSPDAVHTGSAQTPTNDPHHTTEDSPTATSSQSASESPRWGSSPATLQDESATQHGENKAPTRGPAGTGIEKEPCTEESTKSQIDKGKGKAASVEDMAEDAT